MVGVGGRLPLGSDEFGEPAGDRWPHLGVWGPVGAAEHPLVWWSGDVPVVFVDEAVVGAA
jgi:hypothetical protein